MDMKRKWLISFIFLLAVCVGASAQNSLKGFQKFDFTKTILKRADLSKFELEDLSLLRGIVFGRRGRVFKEQTIQNYLQKQSWYKPNPKFDNKILTANERKNIDLIREAEAKKHDSIQPGDLRFWQTKEFTNEQVYANTAAEWRVMIAEVEAIHGKTFADEPWLQKYFEERYWYKPNANYNSSVLSAIEKKNITTLMEARDKDRKVAVSPGDMDKFQNVLLTEDLLKGATLNDLRIMRNEFWARRGKAFSTPGFKSFYEFQDWYKPLKDQSKVKLNDTEKANVALIQNYENKLREKVSTEVLEPETFQGLFVEDLRVLRNEIYARHGRIFKNAELQKMFEAFAWYKPNPDFKDEMLSETESKNLVSIKEAENEAVSKFALVEG